MPITQITMNNAARLPKIGIVRLGLRDSGGRSSEVDHFLFDIQDQALKRKIMEIYGPEPKALDVTFHTNELETVFSCELQRWGMSKKQQPYLMCSGNGDRAREFGKPVDRSCPCSLLGNECRKKTMLRFLLPTITMGGVFLLVTKSHYSTEIIGTTLKIAERSGGLMLRPFKLLRTEGFATVNNFRVKKYYLALVLDDSDTRGIQTACGSGPATITNDESAKKEALPAARAGLTAIRDLIPPALPAFDDAMVIRTEKRRREAGRDKVKRKLRLFINDSRAEAALEAYACDRFQRASFNELTTQELLVLWHDIGDYREVLSSVYDRMQQLTL